MSSIVPMSKEMGVEFSQERKNLIKQTICRGATDSEMDLFIHACTRTGLDPLMKQIYFIKYGGQPTFQVSIDGYRLIAERTGRYSPGREPTFTYDKDGGVLSATSYVKKQTMDGTWHEVAATAYWKEYAPAKLNNMWQKMPHGQLAKCAESLALRKAWPANFSGIYTKEEMEQAGKPDSIEMEAQVIEESPEEITVAINGFLESFNEDEHALVAEFLQKYATHWKKTMKDVVAEFDGNDKFFNLFAKWKEKQKKTHAA